MHHQWALRTSTLSLSQIGGEIITVPITEESLEQILAETGESEVETNAEELTTSEATTTPSKRPCVDDNKLALPFITQDNDNYDSTKEREVDPIFPADPDDHQDFDDMAARINVIFDADEDKSRDLQLVLGHRYVSNVLELLVKYSTGNGVEDEEWHPIGLVKDEDPHAVAQYVLHNDLGPVETGKHRRWARAFLRSLKVTLRRMRRVCTRSFESRTFVPNPKKPTRGPHLSYQQKFSMRRAQKTQGASKKSRNEFKYGIEVPRNWRDIICIDKESGNTNWQDSVTKEVGALIQHGCFEFMPRDFKPTPDYQYCRLHFAYEVKTDLRQKARLVCDGSRVESRGLSCHFGFIFLHLRDELYVIAVMFKITTR